MKRVCLSLLYFIICTHVLAQPIGFSYSEKLEKKAIKGNVEACTKLGYCYYYGIGIQQDYKEAMTYWGIAAFKKNGEEAAYNYGICWEEGKGTMNSLPDTIRAEMIYSFILSTGRNRLFMGLAETRLGTIYLNDTSNVNNAKKAFQCFYHAAHIYDTPAAWCNLGVLYYQGVGIEKSLTKAASCFEYSAERGIKEAQEIMANWYLNGIGVDIDFKKADYWLIESQKHVDGISQEKLSKIFDITLP